MNHQIWVSVISTTPGNNVTPVEILMATKQMPRASWPAHAEGTLMTINTFNTLMTFTLRTR